MARLYLTQEKIINSFIETHGNKYDYHKVVYKGISSKVIIICKYHGDFLQSPHSHRTLKAGCPICAKSFRYVKMRKTTDTFIKEAKEIHGNRYDYSSSIYGQNAFDKVKIKCRQHGNFYISANSHLSRKTGCAKCYKGTGWTKSSWKEKCKDRTAKLYIIKCWNNKELFYKIGITSRDDINDRLYKKSVFPYQYTIIKVIESDTDPVSIWELEKSLHKIHRPFSYVPKIKFGGSTECFNKILIK